MNKISTTIASFIFFGFTFFPACAQTAFTAQKIYAFYTVNMHGNIAVDGNGTPLKNSADTVYTVYIETKGKEMPKWESASKGRLSLNITASSEVTLPIKVGKPKNIDKDFIIMPTKGNHVWKIELQVGDVMKGDLGPSDNIILKGSCKSHKIKQVVNNLVELESALYP